MVRDRSEDYLGRSLAYGFGFSAATGGKRETSKSLFRFDGGGGGGGCLGFRLLGDN